MTRAEVPAVSLPRRPAHWLPHEPMIVALPATADGFMEVTLELGGRVVACRVVCGWDSMRRMRAHFGAVIDANLEAAP